MPAEAGRAWLPDLRVALRDRKSSFLLLTCHTDEEITDFLQKKAENGWWLASMRGNRFRFERREHDGRRLCSFSFQASSAETPTEVQLRQELPLLRREGWDMIAISGPEDIADTRRHAFLYEEHPAASVPKAEGHGNERARKKGRRKSVSNLIVSILYLAFISALFSLDAMRITSSDAYMVAFALFLILLCCSLALSIRAVISIIEDVKDHGRYIRKGLYRFIDHSTRMVFLSLIALVCFLAIDSLYGQSGRNGEKAEIGGEDVVLYSDDIPVTLASLGLDASGEARTAIFRESSSFMADYRYSYEQYLGEGASGDSYLSCTYYMSSSAFLRKLAERQLRNSQLTYEEGLSAYIGAEVLASASMRDFLIRDGDAVIYIRSGKALESRQLEAVAAAIAP